MMGKKADLKYVALAFNRSMLMLAVVNDTCDSAVRDAAGELRAKVTRRQALAMIENAVSSSDDVMQRMRRYLTGKKKWQEYMDYMDMRQEQIAQALTICRISVKQVVDDAGEPDSRLFSQCCMASLLLEFAVKTHRQILVTLRRKVYADFSKTLRGMSMREAQRFFAVSLRLSDIDASAAVADSMNKSGRVHDAFQVLFKKIYNADDIIAAQEYAMNLKEE